MSVPDVCVGSSHEFNQGGKAMIEELPYGNVAFKKAYNSEDWEVVIQSHHRGSLRRLALCASESDAQSVTEALQFAIASRLIS